MAVLRVDDHALVVVRLVRVVRDVDVAERRLPPLGELERAVGIDGRVRDEYRHEERPWRATGSGSTGIRLGSTPRKDHELLRGASHRDVPVDGRRRALAPRLGRHENDEVELEALDELRRQVPDTLVRYVAR